MPYTNVLYNELCFEKCYKFQCGFKQSRGCNYMTCIPLLFTLLEDGGSLFLQIVGTHLPIALHCHSPGDHNVNTKFT